MKMKKIGCRRIISLVTILSIIASLLCVIPAYADETWTVPEGYMQIGTSTTAWKFDSESGTLYIAGEGQMPNFSNADDTTKPWYEHTKRKVTDSDTGNKTTVSSDIKKLVVGEGITHLNNYNFSNCDLSEGVTLSSTVEYIGYCAFSDTKIKNLDFVTQKIWDNMQVYNAITLNCDQLTGSITIPKNVKQISPQSFQNTKITSLAIEGGSDASDLIIKGSAFVYMPNLKELKIYPRNKIELMQNVKENGSNVEKVADSFINLFTLTGNWNLTKIDELNIFCPGDLKNTFESFTDYTTYTPKAIYTIDNTVSKCGAINDKNTAPQNGYWTYGNGKLDIYGTGSYTTQHYQCGYAWKDDVVGTDVTKVVFHEGITEIPSYFVGNADFTNTTTGKTYKKMSNITEVTFPSTLKVIPAGAFVGCAKLSTINGGFPKALESIGNSAFQSCPLQATQNNALVLPASLKTIGNDAFKRWDNNPNSKYTSVVFEKGSQLTSIGERAFMNQTQIRTVAIPSNVTSIGTEAFNTTATDELKVYFEGAKPTTIGTNAFARTGKNATVSVYCYEDGYDASDFGSLSYLTVKKLTSSIDASLELEVGDKVTAKATYRVLKQTDDVQKYLLIIAGYDENDMLVGLSKEEGVINLNTTDNGVITKTIEQISGAEKYRAFLWDNILDIKPLTQSECVSLFDKAEWITAPSIYTYKDNKGTDGVESAKGNTDNAFSRSDGLAVWDDTIGKYANNGEYKDDKLVAVKISADPIFRKTFDTGSKEIVSATAKVTGLGYYEVYINGEKLGEKVLEPFSTLYDKDCVYYSEYDVTNMLNEGKNGVGAVLGRGTYDSAGEGALGMSARNLKSIKYGKQRLKMYIDIEFTDGTSMLIPTDTSWKAERSPIRYDQQAFGEFFDARMESDLRWSDNGWTKADFDDTKWENAVLETKADPDGELVKAPLNYNKVVKTYDNMDVTVLEDNTFRVDVGRVLTGWAGIKNLEGVEGKEVTLHYIENPDTWNKGGSDYQSNKIMTFYYKDKDNIEQSIETYAQTDHYIMKSGENNWAPKFTLKSFRYVDVTFPSDMQITTEQVKAMIYVEEVHANVEETGSFTSSNEIFNKTHDLAKKTLLNNMHSYISDTPLHENAFYLFDGVASAEWGIYNFDMEDYLRKCLRDIRATQDGEDATYPGRLNAIATVYSVNDNAGPEWSEGYAELVWALYQNTGKKDLLTENYDNLKLLLDWETSEARKTRAETKTAKTQSGNRLIDGTLPDYTYISMWGDHVPPSEIYVNNVKQSAYRFYALTATAFVYREAVIVGDIAEALGKTDDAKECRTLAENIKNAFNTNFWDEEKGYYHDAKVCEKSEGATDEFRQTPQILAIKFGLVDESKKAGLLEKLQENIDMLQSNDNSGFSTGLLGNKYIFDVLTENGMVDELYEIFNTDKYPGYGYWLKKGATSMWEYWEAGKRSDNHHMFGSIDKWFYRYLVGITEAEPGYKKTNIKPYIPTGMTNASGSIKTAYGEISSSWTVENDTVKLTVTVPSGIESTVYVPINDSNTIVDAPTGATATTSNDTGYKAYIVSGGTYTFTAR